MTPRPQQTARVMAPSDPMTSHIEQDARFAHAKLKASCDTMRQLLLGLDAPQGQVADDIHAIRKLGKSLRGGFSLFGLSATSAREIQVIGRLLSGPRDAMSRLSTWKKLGWNDDPTSAAAITGLLEQYAQTAATQPPAAAVAWCAERVDAAKKNLTTNEDSSLVENLARRLDKLRRKVGKRCHKLDLSDELAFHHARKALKAYLGAVHFLPEGRIPLSPNVDELADLLGDENDLTTLSAWLESHGFTHQFVPSLWNSIAKAHRKLRKRAIRHATQWSPAETD